MDIKEESLKNDLGGNIYELYKMIRNLESERDEALAKLAAMESQEPIAWGAFYCGGKYSGQLHRHDFSEEQIDRYIAIFHGSDASVTLRKGCLYTRPVPSDKPAVAVPDEPKNPGAAYLQDFLNDTRFDAMVNSMPDALIEKIHSRLVERTADRDDWKLLAENNQEDYGRCKGELDAVYVSLADRDKQIEELIDQRDSSLDEISSLEHKAQSPSHSQQSAVSIHDELLFVGYTNGSQIGYAKESEGAFYKDTDNGCIIPLYMLCAHEHRLIGTPLTHSEEIPLPEGCKLCFECDGSCYDRCPSHESEQFASPAPPHSQQSAKTFKSSSGNDRRCQNCNCSLSAHINQRYCPSPESEGE